MTPGRVTSPLTYVCTTYLGSYPIVLRSTRSNQVMGGNEVRGNLAGGVTYVHIPVRAASPPLIGCVVVEPRRRGLAGGNRLSDHFQAPTAGRISSTLHC